MISISDITAADLLIEAVTVAAIEAQNAKHAPDGFDRTTPMPATRAFFQLGWGDETLRALWANADDAGRETLLTQVAAAPLTVTTTDEIIPVWQDGVVWFFSAADLARAHVALNNAGATRAGAPLHAILSANPRLSMGDGCDAVAFEGGSSVGVMGGSWLLNSADASYVVVIQSATQTESRYIAQHSALYLAVHAAALLAED